MLAKEQDEVIVLGKVNQGEADRIFIALAKNQGKINLFAKGERKILSKLRPGIDSFYQTKITFIESPRRITLTDVDLVDDFPGLRADWRRFEIATWISALLQEVLPQRGKDKEVFSLTLESLKDIRRAIKHFQRYYYYFFWRLLDISGYLPDFNNEKRFFISPETKRLLQQILKKEKKIFYQQFISPTVQKNLVAISKLYAQFLHFGKGGESSIFTL